MTDTTWLVVGLGNPGREYEHSRHNAGARAVESLAGRLGTHLRRSKFRALVGEARTDGVPLKLAFPTTFMNDSGQAVAPLARWHKIDPDHGVSSLKQAGCYMEADKSGIACHQSSHLAVNFPSSGCRDQVTLDVA